MAAKSMVSFVLLIMVHVASGQVARLESLPGHLVQWRMVRVPGDGAVKPFWIGETEVVWELFEVWALRLDAADEGLPAGIDAVSRPSKPYGVIFSNFGHHGFPAICMTHRAATEFCRWLSAKTGRRYRLPKTQEWELAARAGGAPPAGLDECAWFWDNSDDTTHRVATKAPNAWGLYDMLGNVAEWCDQDEGPPVVKGGSWRDKAARVSIELSLAEEPSWSESDPQSPKSLWWLANGQFVGMRLVCED
jgi:formylglycine-generating enzyme required for sulfatase activity